MEENECSKEEINQMKESLEKEKNEVLDICTENNVTIEEVKEISEVLNSGEQMIMEGEEQFGTNQAIPMNIHNGRRAKIKEPERKGNVGKRERVKLERL
jgi:hypothetical protein